MAKPCAFRVGLYLVVSLTLGVVMAWPKMTLPMENSQKRSVAVSKGVFLVAEPHLTDSNFDQTVVLIIAHGPTGSSGLIINRPTKKSLSRVLPDIKELTDWPDPLYAGGPVSRNRLGMLFQGHNPQQPAEPIFDDVYFSYNLNDLTTLLSQPESGHTFRLYAGISGWAPNQLQSELSRGGWRVIPADSNVIFGDDFEKAWPDMIRRSSQQWVRNETKALFH